MSPAETQAPEPPPPPELDRKIRFYPYQWIAIPLLLLIPILGLFGVFGLARTSASASGAGIELEVDYPARALYHGRGDIVVRVRNTTDTLLSAITVSLDRHYLQAFSELSFLPANVVIVDDTYRVALDNVQPGESRVVVIDALGREYGSHSGTVRAQYEGSGPAVTLETFIIP